MGFGLLFFGYFAAFLMSVNSYGFIFSLIGYYIIFTALSKLAEYKHSLSYCMYPLSVLFVCGLCDAASGVMELIGIESFFNGQAVSTVLSLISMCAVLVFHFYMLRGISALAKDTEQPDLAALTRFDFVIVCVYFLLNVADFIYSAFASAHTPWLVTVLLLYRIIYPIFILALIYKCFQRICAPEDIDVKMKPSRFKFVNEFRKKREEKEEETKAARQQLVEKIQAKKSASSKKTRNKK